MPKMPLRLYNTLSGKKEDFVPLKEGRVGMYVCGVTVYDDCHLGHARVAVVFDVIFRYLQYCGYDVVYVRNFTDVDDKIIQKANEEGTSCQEISERYIQEFYHDMSPLSIAKPTHEPKATEHIPQMLDIVNTLIEKGFAYEAGGDVLYAVRKFDDYGKLSKKNVDDLVAGARVEPGEHKKDPLDFVLWKKSKEGEPSWDSPWGPGRPGWHIECSAMGQHYLGDTFDIHGGGKDLVFPHHENEIAQSEAAFGVSPVRFWLHNGFVNIDKEKMSKSLKNFFTIKEIIARYRPEVVRLFLLSTHYRSPVDFSDDQLKETQGKLDRFYEMLKKMKTICNKDRTTCSSQAEVKDNGLTEKVKKIADDFTEAMNDDCNTALAIGNLFSLAREVNKYMSDLDHENKTEGAAVLHAVKKSVSDIGNVLGLFLEDPDEYFQSTSVLGAEEIEQLIQERNDARERKDWKTADSIRGELEMKGIVLEDTAAGTEWKSTVK